MMGKGTNMDPIVVSFALVGAKTNALASFTSGIVLIVYTIYRRRSMIVISSRCLPRVVPGRYRNYVGYKWPNLIRNQCLSCSA